MKRKKTPLYAFGKVVAQPVVWPFIPYTVKNWENIPQDRNFILCANHLAISDPLRLASIEKRQIFFLSKAELFQNKPLAWLLRSLGCIPVQRGRGDVGAIDHAGEVLRRGDIVGIFIEGTRSRSGELDSRKQALLCWRISIRFPSCRCASRLSEASFRSCFTVWSFPTAS